MKFKPTEKFPTLQSLEDWKNSVRNRLLTKAEPKEGDRIVIWFSSGAASAVAAKRTIEKYGNLCDVRVVNNPIAEENLDNLRFLADVERWLGKNIEFAKNRKYPNASIEEVFDDVSYMAGINGAVCTDRLKRQARAQWEENNHTDWLVMGFTYDEKARSDAFAFTERNNLLPILVNDRISRQDCFAILRDAGLTLPITYYEGWPNGNCPGCVKASSPTYWNFVRKNRPDVFKSRCEQSRRLGVKLVRHKGKRIYLDELPESAAGRPIKSMKMPECGLFCEGEYAPKSTP